MRIQIKTFTRWCNQFLKQKGVVIEDLRMDLSNGTNLIILLEVLSQKKVGRGLNKKNEKLRMFRSHHMENVETALRFITETEGLQLVNIGE